jgi:hypothetical protein
MREDDPVEELAARLFLAYWKQMLPSSPVAWSDALDEVKDSWRDVAHMIHDETSPHR